MEFLQQLDQRTLQWFQAHWNPTLDLVMIDLSAMGGWVVLSVMVIFVVGLLFSLRRYRTAGFVLGAALGGVLLAYVIKREIHRPRPNVHHPNIPPATSLSFPSGHSMMSAVVYLTLAEIAAAILPRRRVRVYVIGSSLVLVFLIGVSRMYLGVHYLTDVVGGWTGGLAWAIACRWVEAHWVLRAEKKNIEQRTRNNE